MHNKSNKGLNMQTAMLGNEHTDRVKEEANDNESMQSNVQMNA